jgi:hypothetical protein
MATTYLNFEFIGLVLTVEMQIGESADDCQGKQQNPFSQIHPIVLIGAE